MAYWPFPNGLNGISKDYFQAKIDPFLFDVYLESSPFTSLMGANDSNAICVKGIEDSQGGAAIFGRLQSRDYKRPILNQDQVRGVDRFEKTDTMTVAPDKITFKIDRRDVSVEQYAAKIHLTEGQARRLASDHRQYRDYEIFRSATIDLYSLTKNGSMPRVERAVAGNLDAANAGDGVYTYNAAALLSAQLLTAMPDVRKTNHRLSVGHIMRLRQKALDKYGADPLQPMEVLQWNGYDEPRFLLYVPPVVADFLRKDTDFKAMQLQRGVQLPYQGSPIIGGFFVGRVHDVDVVEVPSMADADFKIDTANNKYGWSLFMGRGAWGMFQKTGLFYHEEWDKVEDCMFQIARQHMGVSALVFPNPKNAYTIGDPVVKIEQGIIHSFTRID